MTLWPKELPLWRMLLLILLLPFVALAEVLLGLTYLYARLIYQVSLVVDNRKGRMTFDEWWHL